MKEKKQKIELPNNHPSHPILTTVIIPTLNCQKDIQKTLQSLLKQDLHELQIIIVDRCSVDLTCALVADFAKQDLRISLIKQLNDNGEAYAINEALMRAKGKYTIVIRPGIEFFPDSTRSITNFADKKRLLFIYSLFFKRNFDDFDLSEFGISDSRKLFFIFKTQIILEKIGFLDSVKLGAKLEYFLRARSSFGEEKVCIAKTGRNPFTLFLRKTLTKMMGHTRVEYFVDQILKSNQSPPFKQYFESFQSWHKDNSSDKLFVHFPQSSRPFPLRNIKNDWQGAEGDFLKVAIVLFKSSDLVRLKIMIESILPQIDIINICLNPSDPIPSFLKNPKIQISRRGETNLRDLPPYLPLENQSSPGYFFSLADTVNYPPNYASETILAIEKYNRRAVVGYEGIFFSELQEKRSNMGTVCKINDESSSDKFVASLSNRSLAFHSDLLETQEFIQFSHQLVNSSHWVGNERSTLPFVCLKKDKNWLRAEDTFPPILENYNNNQTILVKQESPETTLTSRNFLTAKNESTSNLFSSILKKTSEFDAILAGVDTEVVRQICKREIISFSILINGWNCEEFVGECIGSIYNQIPNYFNFDLYVIDDGSDDGTFAILEKLQHKYGFYLDRNSVNRGAAFSRWKLIKAVSNPQSKVILLDLDDRLKRYALSIVARTYRENKNCLLTYGNWESQHGEKNSLPFYSEHVKRDRSYRKVPNFQCAPLRTFDYSLVANVNEYDLKDSNGKWLKVCTDVAIMLPLLEQCKPENIAEIEEPIYVYNKYRSTSTLLKFGKEKKNEVLKDLFSREPKNDRLEDLPDSSN